MRIKIHFPHSLFSILAAGFLAASCGNPVQVSLPTSTASATSSSVAGADAPAARLIFSEANFTNLSDFVTNISTSYRCLGDVIKVFYADAPDFTGTPVLLPTASVSDALSPTNKPAFIKNASVDMTNTYYPETQAGVMASDACSYRLSNTAPLASFCADFDVAGAAYPTPTATPFPTPTATPVYANTGMYRVHDELCTGQGPVLSADPDATKTYVGGVNIDLDRTQLGAAEDLLMVVTYHAERAGDESWPANSAVPTGGTTEAATRPSDTIMPNGVDTALRVDLIGTNSSLNTLMGVPQPRVYSYFDQPSYPIYMQEIATLQDPYGSLRSEQVYIPLSKNGLVDRIRIERIRGSYILYQVDLYRLGDRE